LLVSEPLCPVPETTSSIDDVAAEGLCYEEGIKRPCPGLLSPHNIIKKLLSVT
jgi:hypothetical protein